MCALKISFNQVEQAISVMREVSAWGREQGYRVWPDEWLTEGELITSDAQPENFCIGTILTIGPMRPSMKLPIFINSACCANSPGWV